MTSPNSMDLPQITITTEHEDPPQHGELRQQPIVESPPAETKTWSDADAIRQVEYYFSDTNLPTDAYLLARCGGHQNLPVSIKRICGFSRMKSYKPVGQVVNALKNSKQLEVVDDKYIRRRQPLTLPLQVEPDENEVRRQELLSQDGVTKGMLKPTGFEDYYTDPPISPEVYAQEREIYDTYLSFADRIERAVHRYVRRRKFHSDVRRIFNGWMKFGGIEERPRISGQLSKAEMEDMTADEIAEALAVHWCLDDVSDESKIAIDIEGVAMAFFSSYAPSYLSADIQTPSKIAKATNILRNFYNYIIAHDVAPEFEVHIHAARALCTRACVELTGIYHLRSLLPGSFNMACSTLYASGPEHIESNFHNTWNAEQGSDVQRDHTVSKTMTRDIIKPAIAAYGTEAQFEAANKDKMLDFAVVEEISRDFEVISISPADEEIRSLYAHANSKRLGPKLPTLGKLVLKPWVRPDFIEYDLPAHLTPEDPSHPDYCPDETYTLWIDEEILQHFHRSPLTTHRPIQQSPGKTNKSESDSPGYTTNTEEVGTKIMATIKKLCLDADTDTEGIWFLDSFARIYPSFYTILPNELMRGWKKPAPSRKLLEVWGLREDEVDENGQILPPQPESKTAKADADDQDYEGAEAEGAGVWGAPVDEEEEEEEKAFI